jgi:protein tyrosine/serine phosphatase
VAEGGGAPAPGLDGAFNFRDLGGLPAVDGRRVRRGVLYRSDTLQALSEGDVDRLVRELGIGLVVDLRGGLEATEQGRGPLAAGTTCYLNAPLPEAPATDEPAERQTLQFYLANLAAAASPLPTLLQLLSSVAGRVPTVLHCAAGKDRTGLVTALVLRLIGVEEDAVVGDYLRTEENMARIVDRFLGWPRYRDHMQRVPAEVYRADESTIRGFLRELDARYGGPAGWAAARGVDEHVIHRLTRGLLEPADRSG